jgi:hypothetical protein
LWVSSTSSLLLSFEFQTCSLLWIQFARPVCNELLQAVIPLPSVATTQLLHAFREKVATPSLRITQIARSGLKHTSRGPILALNGLSVAQKLTLQPLFLQSSLILHSFHRLHFHLGTFVVSRCWLTYLAFACPSDSLPLHLGRAMSSSPWSLSLEGLRGLFSLSLFLEGLNEMWHMS